MGCSASRSAPTQFTTTITTTATTTTTTSSPFSDHHDTSSSTPAPVSRTMSLPTPLVHHPSLRKGDSHHFVSLTSTTYGSLTDITKSISDTPASSPDSVINTWELMEGLDDKEDNNNHANNLNCNGKLTDGTDYVSFGLGGPYEMVEYPDVKKPLWKHSLPSKTPEPEPEGLCLPGCKDRIVLYYTSLRGIRKTYEDCCEIRLILQGFRVFVDERDISLDSSYRDELKSVFDGKGFSLPQVFIKGKHVGGADEVKRLHEDGKLIDLMKGFRVMDSARVCYSCGDVRFVPCTKCNGSRKCFMEGVWRAVKCPNCNENGLIRCVSCS